MMSAAKTVRWHELNALPKAALIALWQERHPAAWTSTPVGTWTVQEIANSILADEFPATSTYSSVPLDEV